MKYLKEYYNYDNQVAEICEKYSIENWSIRDGLVDVNDVVYLDSKKLTKLPLKFGEVDGDFFCSNNNLTTLEGAPKEVSGSFICNINNLITLEGVPKEIGGDFLCYTNKLTTLEHFPNVKGDIYIDVNPLPKEIYNNISLIKYIVKYQDEYDIWFNGKLDIPRFNLMISDIKEFDLKN
jgi:hypothetical protein